MAKLGDVFPLVRNGASIRQTDGATGIPITRIETISNREIDRNKFGYANIIDGSKYKDYILQDGDILMSHINSEKHLGKVALYRKQGNEQIIHGMNLLMLRANPSVLFPPYATYFFETPAFLMQIQKITKKSVNQASFTVTALKEIEIPLPPLGEQCRIAAVLDKVSGLIAKRREQLDKLDELVKARFVEMFGDPSANSQWPTQKLSKLGELNRGVSKHRPRNDPALLGGPYPLIQTGDVSNSGLYILDYSSTYSELGLAQSRLWKEGTLCITIAANIAQTSILAFDACFPDSVVGFLPGEKTNAVFVHYWFSFFQKILEEQAPQVAQKNINLKILSDLDVIVPPYNLQADFSDFVRQAEKSKLTIQQSLDKLEVLKKALMQQYFG
mgnify:CR=1 FL=1